MKWTVHSILVGVILLFCAPCFAKQDHLFLNLEKAKHFKKSSLVGECSLNSWLVSAGVGTQFPHFKSSMSINNGSGASPPYDQDIYTTKSRSQPIVDLSVGYRWAWIDRWIPAVSTMVSYQHLFSRNVGGNVIQYSDPTFTNYGYDWEVSSDVVLALLKLNLVEYAHTSPYISGGVGGAVNRMSHYNEGALSGVTPRTNPAFQSTSRLKFAYRVGGGIDYQMNTRVIVSAEYQYQGIGAVSSKHGIGSWATQFLNLGSYRANAVLLNVTYLVNK